jgi:hypothetical protein
MSERLTPEQLEHAANAIYIAIAEEPANHIAKMLRQAATDARTLQRLREWLREGNTTESLVSWHIARRVLAELDRLEREP